MESVDVKVIIKKEIPEKQLEQFADRSVYFTAMLTREFTKGASAYPRKTGELARQEIRSPILKMDTANYGLLRGTDYAQYVYKMTDVKWTNPSTLPQWYSTIYRQREKAIIEMAQDRALKELE